MVLWHLGLERIVSVTTIKIYPLGKQILVGLTRWLYTDLNAIRISSSFCVFIPLYFLHSLSLLLFYKYLYICFYKYLYIFISTYIFRQHVCIYIYLFRYLMNNLNVKEVWKQLSLETLFTELTLEVTRGGRKQILQKILNTILINITMAKWSWNRLMVQVFTQLLEHALHLSKRSLFLLLLISIYVHIRWGDWRVELLRLLRTR